MTKKQKYSPKSRFNSPISTEEDIELADLEVGLDDTDITPVPLNNYLDDEEIIDTLLVDKYANSHEEIDQELDDDKFVEDLDLVDEVDTTTQFNIGPVDDDEEVEIEPTSIIDKAYSVIDTREHEVTNDGLLINADNVQLKQVDDEASLNTATDELSERDSTKLGTPIPDKPDGDNDYSNEDDINQEQLTEAEVNANNNALLLIKRALLTDTAFITSIESRVRLANLQKKKPKLEQPVDNNDPRKKTFVVVVGGLLVVILIALSIKVYLLSAEISKLQSLTSILEEDVSILHEKKSVLESESNHVSSEAIPQSGQAIIKEEKPIAEEVKRIPEPVNIIQEVSKPLDHDSESKKLTKLQTAPTAPKKLVVDKKLAVKEFKKNPKNQVAKSGWFVNLVTFKVQNEAKKKSVNLIAQGIPVKISTFNAKNTQWYQLSVNGFKNKEAAQSYANKIKKSLDLKTITVQNN
ncbi:MAG: SPOR domain-containing protein [Methylococcales bacterium]|nr:SPOR domain-containing protein [Methylococcales bacterium]